MDTLNLLFSLVIITCVIVLVVNEFYNRKTKIPPVPTLPWTKKKMLAAALKHRPDGNALHIAELGSGWGGLLGPLSRAFSGAHITAFEFSPIPFFVSSVRLWLNKRVQILRRDFLKEDLSSFDLVICYLSPRHMQWLKPKFEAELQEGSFIISNAFPIPDWTPIEEIHIGGPGKVKIYVYQK